ncbi:MAG: ferredoxin, partial [Bacteroidetes bacterium HGW-Bacteroidetes-17]
NGGGQHIGASEEAIRARMQSIYAIDDKAIVRVSHQNPEVIALYENYLEEPLGHKSHQLLHTKYTKRNVLK